MRARDPSLIAWDFAGALLARNSSRKGRHMNIGIIGTGYVGLVSGVCLSAIGHTVICVDNDKEKVKKLKNGIATIYEPGLQELMTKQIKKKKLLFSDSIKEAAKKSQVIFIAVGTPSKKNGDADLTYVENVARQIAESMDSYKLIVEKSTVPAETGKRIEHTIKSVSYTHLTLPTNREV